MPLIKGNLKFGIFWPLRLQSCLDTMMFCTTFLSAPSEDLGCDGTGSGPLHYGHLGPGSCLSSLHCLVLPQDELYPSLSERTGSISVRSNETVGRLVGNVPLDAKASPKRDSGRIWDRVRGRRSRSASPSPSKTPQSPYKHSNKGNTYVTKYCE